MEELNPLYHVLHIPYTKPTLTPVPEVYFSAEHRDNFIDQPKQLDAFAIVSFGWFFKFFLWRYG
jgi:hypothetical protein